MPEVIFISPNWECSNCHTPVKRQIRVVDGKISPTYFYLPQKCEECGKLLDFYKVLEGYTLDTIKSADRVLV